MGGLVMNIGEIDGYLQAGTVSGVELAAAKLEAIAELGVAIISESARDLSVEGDVKFVTTDSGVIRAKTVVLASGARLRSLGVPGEEALFGRGVSQCAYCDGMFFANQSVVVIGGGDSALQEALHLAETANKITVVTRGEALRAKPGYITRAMNNPKFEFRLSTIVSDIVGTESVEGVRLVATGNGEPEALQCCGVFVFVGLEPNAGYVPNNIERDEDGFIVTSSICQTSAPGVYAVGAVRAGDSGQLAEAVKEAEAVIAGLQLR